MDNEGKPLFITVFGEWLTIELNTVLKDVESSKRVEIIAKIVDSLGNENLLNTHRNYIETNIGKNNIIDTITSIFRCRMNIFSSHAFDEEIDIDFKILACLDYFSHWRNIIEMLKIEVKEGVIQYHGKLLTSHKRPIFHIEKSSLFCRVSPELKKESLTVELN